MAVAFTHLSWWLWSGKSQKPKITNSPCINSPVDSGMWESDALRFPWVNQAKMGSSSRRTKRKWHNREKQKIDTEYDVVLVPSDGGCVSDSESDGSDWSIGWLEPHGPEFPSDDESDKSFAVLVPCYGRQYSGTLEDPKSNILTTVGNFPDNCSDESKKYVENWLSSLQNS
ncbi:uncharacterized protein LOC114757362 [Neltuma alba]|uniref:uncharacterized protein LOC114757362 n=1 Tax=Neltuma alba TaxID=207710 RepID=UPI0010A4F1E9|nr:uncharacterized protein LOC114757362 [Prosopis alba]XP_028802221.1 uncharacterized protein LOC114757362 [Prosopis alba]XP_028802223.1 uncharacterized protein LOC114757362 [Prosopis alba]